MFDTNLLYSPLSKEYYTTNTITYLLTGMFFLSTCLCFLSVWIFKISLKQASEKVKIISIIFVLLMIIHTIVTSYTTYQTSYSNLLRNASNYIYNAKKDFESNNFLTPPNFDEIIKNLTKIQEELVNLLNSFNNSETVESLQNELNLYDEEINNIRILQAQYNQIEEDYRVNLNQSISTLQTILNNINSILKQQNIHPTPNLVPITKLDLFQELYLTKINAIKTEIGNWASLPYSCTLYSNKTEKINNISKILINSKEPASTAFLAPTYFNWMIFDNGNIYDEKGNNIKKAQGFFGNINYDTKENGFVLSNNDWIFSLTNKKLIFYDNRKLLLIDEKKIFDLPYGYMDYANSNYYIYEPDSSYNSFSLKTTPIAFPQSYQYSYNNYSFTNFLLVVTASNLTLPLNFTMDGFNFIIQIPRADINNYISTIKLSNSYFVIINNSFGYYLYYYTINQGSLVLSAQESVSFNNF